MQRLRVAYCLLSLLALYPAIILADKTIADRWPTAFIAFVILLSVSFGISALCLRTAKINGMNPIEAVIQETPASIKLGVFFNYIALMLLAVSLIATYERRAFLIVGVFISTVLAYWTFVLAFLATFQDVLRLQYGRKTPPAPETFDHTTKQGRSVRIH